MSKNLTRHQTKQERRRDRREEQRRQDEQHRQHRQRLRWITIGIVAVVLIAAIATVIFYTTNNAKSAANQSGTTATATASNQQASVNPLYPAVDGISCDSTEQLAYHIHAHLSIYIQGQAVPLPANIGVSEDSSCIYWLHVHRNDGVVHIESPKKQLYTLGNFLHLWGGQFSKLGYPSQLGQSSGWQAYVDGKPYNGDFRAIELNEHTLITLAYQSPNVKPDTVYSWNAGE